MKNMIVFAGILSGFMISMDPAVSLSKVPVETTDKRQRNSDVMDAVFDYFKQLGSERKIEEAKHEAYFTEDFEMIINGRLVLDSRAKMAPHFEHLLSQTKRVDLILHEKVVADDKVVMRYDLPKEGLSNSKVIAIFKFRDGKIYEMNEVVHSVDPKTAIDCYSK